MKFSLSWLKDHLDTEADLKTITDTLTAIGLELEELHDPAAELGAFTVGYVAEAGQHPDADRLRLCKVETGSETLQIVCGAPNARAGIKVALAKVGSIIPSTGDKLKKGKIRGVESQGMMCSAQELNIGDDHDGIIELPEDAPIGAPIAGVLGLNDPVIEINLTPNRPDCAGVRGVARDLAAAGIGTLKPLARSEYHAGSFASPISVSIDDAVQSSGDCSVFYGRYIRGVKNGESPAWLKARLESIGLRPISALVDITNLVTFDLGRPLHVFDADKVNGNIHVRYGKEGEQVEALNDKTYALDGSMVAICDDHGAEGVGGIIGGTPTGCTDETVNVFLECALFDRVKIAQTGRKLNVITDARYRFERGVDPASVPVGVDLAVNLILELCGGEVSEPANAGEIPDGTSVHPLRLERIKALGGIEVADDRALEILTTLGFTPEASGERTYSVTAPSWRPDVEGEADLVEEVIRIVGYDNIPVVPMERETALPVAVLTEDQRRVGLARRTLAGRGLDETVTWSFTDSQWAKHFVDLDEAMYLFNPISSDLDVMRPSGLVNLLAAVAKNQKRGFNDVRLFETGPEFFGGASGEQKLVVAGVRAGAAIDRNWTGGAREADVFDVKADVLAVLEALGQPAGSVQLVQGQAPKWYHPGRSAVLQLGPKNRMGAFGEIHPKILKALDVQGRVVAFEIYPDAVPKPKKKGTNRPMLNASPFQAVDRDFAFLLDADVPADKVIRAAKGADKTLIADVRVFDLYAGKGIEDGKKSLAFAITLQPTKATLTDEEIDAVSKKVIAAVEKATGGALRG